MADAQMAMETEMVRDSDEDRSTLTKEEIFSEMRIHLEENKYGKLEESFNALRTTSVLITLLGLPGTGKSYFINNMLGLEEGDEGAAIVGDSDTTTERTVYTNPKHKLLEFADLPGFGTPDFEMSDKFLHDMKADITDLYLIFHSNTITKSEQEAIQNLLAFGKKFALVRTRADEMLRRKGKPLEQSIAERKENSRRNLKKFGIHDDVEIFVISNTQPEIGEFKALFEFMETNLSKIKRESLVVHVYSLTNDIIEKKRTVLSRRAWKAAAIMGATTAVPIPGIDIPINLAALIEEVQFSLETFGLNNEIWNKYPEEEKKQLKTTKEIYENGITKFIIGNIAKAPIVISVMFVQQAIEMLLPFIGSIITGKVAYTFYFNFLKDIIMRLAEDAKTVRKLHVESAV